VKEFGERRRQYFSRPPAGPPFARRRAAVVSARMGLWRLSPYRRRARASALTLSSGEAGNTSTDCRDAGIPPSAPLVFHRPQQAPGVVGLPGHGLQKPNRELLDINLSGLQRVTAGQRRQWLTGDAALLEVRGQGRRSVPVARPRPALGGSNPCRADPAVRDQAEPSGVQLDHVGEGAAMSPPRSTKDRVAPTLSGRPCRNAASR
jgi:hypothetical protein